MKNKYHDHRFYRGAAFVALMFGALVALACWLS